MVAAPRVTTKPYVTYSLIGVNVVIFVLCLIQAKGTNMFDSSLFLNWSLFKPSVANGEYWRLLTAGFLHFSVTHIAVNMISLYILGRDLEIAIGWPRYLGVYLASLLGGSAAVMAFGSDLAVNAGASGAIYGLMGAMLVIVLKAKVSPVPVISIIAFNIILSVTIPNISLMAHLGGLVFGALATAGIIFGPQLVSGGRPSAATASRIGWIAIGALIVIALAIGVGIGMSYPSPAIQVR